jgi:dipeptide/tripeptide permease
MKKMIPLLGFSVACIITVAACRHTSKTTASHNNKVVESEQLQAKTVVSTWKTYLNKQLHISFQYPATWNQLQVVNVVNSTGIATSTEVQFEDTLQKKRFLLVYHPASAGESLFWYALQQYNETKGWYAENKKEMIVAGKKTLVATSKVTINGKGNVLSTPLKSVVVVFLDQQNKGEFELQFTVSDDGSAEDKELQHVLSSFQFIQ